MITGFEKIVEERIKIAQEKGEFDDLPGYGKQIPAESDLSVPEDLKLAYKILKNADCIPPELEIKKEIMKTEDLLAGMEETAAFLWLVLFYRTGGYDLIVIDSAPTGETLKHLTLPQVSQWWLTKVLPVQKLAKNSMGKVVRKVTGLPVDTGLQELETFYDKLMQVHEIMSKPNISTIRLVMNPERMVIQEALRAYTYLQLYGYTVDGVVVNRILPPESSESMFSDYFEAQQRYLDEITDSFAPLPIFRVPHLGQEVFGADRLRKIVAELYQGEDPRQVFYHKKPYHFIEQQQGYLLSIQLLPA